MFTKLLRLPETYTWPVKIKYPVDGGKVDVVNVDAVFRRVSTAESEEILKSARPTDGSVGLVYSKIVDDVLQGMRATNDSGISDDVPADVQKQIRAIIGADRCLAMAFVDSVSGDPAKN